jgi:hypothetical protein
MTARPLQGMTAGANGGIGHRLGDSCSRAVLGGNAVTPLGLETVPPHE